jgi:hypothetical protein
MSSKARIFTSCNLAYLPQALVLLASIRRFHNDFLVSLVLVEEKMEFPPLIQVRLDEFDQVIFPEDLWGEERFENLFSYDVVEACTAIKGPALAHLLEEGLPVIYLDPDVVLFSPLDHVLEQLKVSSILLTPHQLTPMSLDGWGGNFDERTTLLTGVFNFGFFAVNPDVAGIEFSTWFSLRTTFQAFDMPTSGLFTDQKWGNLVPVLFPDAHILRHRGMNVASWNLHERRVHVSPEGEFMVDNDPLVFFHFTKNWSGLDPVKQKSVNNYYVASLWRWYLEMLMEERSRVPLMKWSYKTYFDTKQVIESSERRAFRRFDKRIRILENPFLYRNRT